MSSRLGMTGNWRAKKRFKVVYLLLSETVPKLSVSLVGHGFSRAKILVISYFANLKVRPTQKYLNFDPVSLISC